MTPTSEMLSSFGIHTPVFVAQTGIATIWKVNYRDGFAALKIYKNGNTQDEWDGFHLLEALQGNGTALIYQRTQASALIEWLDGPSLGDLARSGQDDVATVQIGRVANMIHASGVRPNLRSLAENFEALLTLKISTTLPHEVQSVMAEGQSVAKQLLTTQVEICALHGDLHHDNIKLGAHGYVAFDAKGLIGDRAYDVANAFKNPVDAPDIYGDPSRMTGLADTLGTIMNVQPKRLLAWASAHCALSIAWTGQIADDPDMAQLQKLLTAYQSAR